MSRAIHRLSARQVQTLTKTGRHADGGGLYLRITSAGAKSWVFMMVIAGKRKEIGLGPASLVSLAAARSIASSMRDLVAAGLDPRQALRSNDSGEELGPVTFSKFAEDYISSVEGGWRNEVHKRQWRNTLRDHAKLIADMPIERITTEDVLGVLKPIWLEIPETANRVRNRIEKILNAAKVRGLRPQDAANPAQWRGHLEFLLPKQDKLKRGHHRALPWKAAPQFLNELRQRRALAARALEFTILTAARSGEVLRATWNEIDLADAVWTIGASRMKAGKEHIVPLSAPAVSLLKDLKVEDADGRDYVFSEGASPLSPMAMSMLLRRMGCDGVTVHGFRSTFRDWAGDATDYPRELIEQALAHTIANKAEAAYRRGQAVERRRGLMNDWASYLQGV